MHKYQGSLDGLCGPYAVVNAFHLLDYGDEVLEEVFKAACQSPAHHRWPRLLWEGTGFGDLQRMIRAAMKLPCVDASKFYVAYPFYKKKELKTAKYWEIFYDITDDKNFLCGIFRRTKPSDHWIVFKRDGKRIRFYDTDPKRPLIRRNTGSIDTAGRRRRPSNWLVKQDETVIIRSNP
ncbi:hypothetical protein [Acidithiobacillus ferrooxidans]|uniref:hypothetical protein n=1 Tax=Acidithiobacillus ferrooxidans TaxID=920 RepID=UPI0013D5427B|nr:hypothetical protein [Acidithiobacillus ferrooxidans]